MIDPRTKESGNKIYKSKFKSMAMIKSMGNLGIKTTKANFSIQKYEVCLYPQVSHCIYCPQPKRSCSRGKYLIYHMAGGGRKLL